MTDRELVPAKVLSLIRDGKVSTISGLRAVWNLSCRTDFESFALENQLKVILDNLVDAGLVHQDGEKLAPTEVIGRIQKALHLSLAELSRTQIVEADDMFVHLAVIQELRLCVGKKYDLSKVVRFCEELNSSFTAGNYIASTLLLRALLNHVPPVFGHTSFQQVVSQSGKSVRELLKPLEEIARDVADLHSHALIRHKESLPTKSQIAPFKANVEVLLHEIIAKDKELG